MFIDPNTNTWENLRLPGGAAGAIATGGLAETRTELGDLRRAVGRLTLLNQALWELLQRHLPLHDEDLLKLAGEIDLRDGKADGQLLPGAVRCPKCLRTCNARHQRCLYCGQEFAGDVFVSSGQ